MATLYILTRNCCTSGHCFACARSAPSDAPLRVEQLRTQDKVLATTAEQHWRAYAPALITQSLIPPTA